MINKRSAYIDWMKAWGMLAIIWGHCFPDGMSNFIYAFNVPVFFVISGYLTNREESFSKCLNKTWDSLMIPYLILAFIKCLGFMLKHLSDGLWGWSVVGILGGFHTLCDASGCNNLWFVYCLIFIKLCFAILPKSKKSLLVCTLLALTSAYIYNYFACKWYWAVTNALLAYPFFILGNVLRYEWADVYRKKILEPIRGMNNFAKMLVVAVSALCVYIIGWQNGCVEMYVGLYGNNMILCILGALIGCIMILVLSIMLENLKWKGVGYINMGMIVILTFHRELLHPLLKLLGYIDVNIVVENIIIFGFACITIVAFIPIIMLIKLIFPIVLGRNRVNAISKNFSK